MSALVAVLAFALLFGLAAVIPLRKKGGQCHAGGDPEHGGCGLGACASCPAAGADDGSPHPFSRTTSEPGSPGRRDV